MNIPKCAKCGEPAVRGLDGTYGDNPICFKCLLELIWPEEPGERESVERESEQERAMEELG